jgi:hypothetical protein
MKAPSGYATREALAANPCSAAPFAWLQRGAEPDRWGRDEEHETGRQPNEYLSRLSGWRRGLVERLRSAVLEAEPRLQEVIKWGHLVYSSNGPVLLIRAEDERVLFGLWPGQRLQEIEPRLKAGGKYEMATVELREGDEIELKTVRQLTREAVALNESYGDPRDAARK